MIDTRSWFIPGSQSILYEIILSKHVSLCLHFQMQLELSINTKDFEAFIEDLVLQLSRTLLQARFGGQLMNNAKSCSLITYS